MNRRRDDPGTASDYAPGLERLFGRPAEEGSYDCTEIAGELPPRLRGTYRVNGPARFARGEVAYRNWLDGDGYVAALTFGDSGVHFAGRFVRGRKLAEEEAAGRALYRTFGTSFPGDRLLRTGLASPVNVSVHPFAGKLLAFGEQGLPWSLEPRTLATLGEEDFGRLSPLAPFSAHPAFDLESGEMVNFGISFAADRPVLQLFAFHADGTLRDRFRSLLPHPYSVHDFALSPRCAAFYLAPYVLDVAALLEGGATVLDSLAWRPELGTRLRVVARDDGRTIVDLPLGERYCLHHVNAFEDGDRLVLDLLELEEPVYRDYQGLPNLFVRVAPTHPVRLSVDLAAGRLLSRHEIPFRWAADFPTHHPALRGRRCRTSFMLAIAATGQCGRKFFDRLVGLDWEELAVAQTYAARPGCYLGGDPVVAPTPEGDFVLCQEHDPTAGRSSLLLFAATDLARGPVAAIPLTGALAPGFHASWEPDPTGLTRPDAS